MVLAEIQEAGMANPYPETESIHFRMKGSHVISFTLRWLPQETGPYQGFRAAHFCWQVGNQEVIGTSSLGKLVPTLLSGLCYKPLYSWVLSANLELLITKAG